ncbi:MAG: hypothetical protein FWD49_01130 [Firmicutes bacterium]|nr:hypothetical protein [Bacillota bacterium]
MTPFVAEIPINKSDFLILNAYYLRKYIGLREFILLAVLFTLGSLLYFMSGLPLIFILACVTLGVIFLGVFVFIFTSVKGYDLEFTKRGAYKWQIKFYEDTFEVTQCERDKDYNETRKYQDIEKLALKKDRVFIYGSASVMFYIKHNHFTEGDFANFCEFLKTKVTAEQLRMKKRRKKRVRHF